MPRNGDTKIIDKGYDKIIHNLKDTDGAKVDIGILSGEEYPENKGITVAEVAIVQEFGSNRANIPERSFLRSTVDRNRRKYRAHLRKSFQSVINGDTTVMAALSLFGERVVGDVKRKITAIRSPKNAPSTIGQKGFDNPLIESGTLRSRIKKRVSL